MDVEEALEYVFPDLVEKGLEKGRKEGADSKEARFITNMIRDNAPVEKILEYTGASKERVREIARSIGAAPVV